MADKVDRSRPTISLPQGGGALRSLGETFSPDVFTGTGNFSVPITLPPGRNGFQPSLALSYSTGNGNGPFGLGWQLNTPGISRKTAKGVPTYGDADVFVLAASEDLVRVPSRPAAPARQRYRPRTEAAFALIERTLDTANDFWEVTSTNGLVSVFGMPAVRGSDPTVVARPDAARRQAFCWKLSETRDLLNNVIEYRYDRDTVTAATRQWDQLYLSGIRFVDDEDALGARRFAVTVSLLYDDRPDPFSEYRAGFEIRTRRRCTTVRVSTEVGQLLRVRDYELAYVEDPSNGVSLLASVTVAGYGTPDTNGDQDIGRLPPVSFDYTTFEPKARRFVALSGSLPTESLLNPNYELVDLRGSGLPDIVQIDDSIRYWRNRGHGRFDPPRLMRSAPAGLALAQAGVQLVDADGDGRTDLLVSTPEASGFFPITTEGTWEEGLFTRHATAPTFALDDADVRLIDLDGDGVIDALRSGRRLECFFNDRQAGWQDTRQFSRAPLDRFPDVVFSDPRVRIADMSGDGLQDIVFVHDRSIEYWPNLGYGRWGSKVQMTASPHFPIGFDPKRVLLGDVDGDGLADVVYVDDREVRIWINQSGNGFSSTPTVVRGTPPVTNLDSLRVADLFGSGTSGVLWSADASTFKRKTFWFLDLTGGRKPYLLASMTNNLGAITRVGYVSSTEERLRDEPSPQTRWRMPLPFPVQVVSRVEVIDELSGGKLTTTYRYHQGYWDGVEREFRGFGMVEQIDSESFDDYHAAGLASDATSFQAVGPRQFSPPTLLKTWFHQGAIARPSGDWRESGDAPDYWPGDQPLLDHQTRIDQFLDSLDDGTLELTHQARRDALRSLRGRVLRSELYALDDDAARRDRPYTVTEQTYGVVEFDPPSPAEPPRPRVFFPHAVASRTTQRERGDDPMTRFEFTRYEERTPGGRVFDPFGRVRAQTSVAMPRRSLRRSARTLDETRILATHTTTAYAVSSQPNVFIHDRVSDTRSYELTTAPGLTELDAASVISVLRDQAAAAVAVAEIFDQAATGTVRLFAHTMHHYDGQPFRGLPTGEIETLGLPARTESLAFGENELAAYGTRRPDYLGGALARPAGAPADTATGLGYHVIASPLGTPAYYVDVVTRTHNSRGLPVAWRDAFGGETTAIYDDRDWLLTSLVDPLGNRTVTAHDYRVCQPSVVTDANGNQTRVEFSPIGLPLEVWTLGQPNRVEGSRGRPTMRFEYDFFAFVISPPGNRQPAMTRRIRYLRDDTDPAATAAEKQETLESREYSDGFGRLLQQRAQAEDVIFGNAPFGGGDTVLPASPVGSATTPVTGVRNANPAAANIVISGWQTFDNKGRVVERFEPSFATGWTYSRPAAANLGQRVTTVYDPLGRLVRAINPDGSEQRVVFGVPSALNAPSTFTSTPWETYVYDANDLAPVSQHPTRVRPDGTPASLEDQAPASHHFTPSSRLVDPLGRTLVDCQRLGPDSATEWFLTHTEYDIRGNVVAVVDALGREAFAYDYDLLNRLVRSRQLDGGVRTSVLDATGALVEARDDEDRLVVNRYDAGRRLVSMWARNDATQALTERQRIEFIDASSLQGFTLAEARAANLLSRTWRHYDEAGVERFEERDLRGNLLKKTRHVISDAAIAAGWVASWNAANAEAALDAVVYTTATTYDALNRQIALTCPNPTGAPSVIEPRYNRAGSLQSIALNGVPIVRDIAYNAKAQRVLIHRGNGLLTRYAYDGRSFRLRRIRTEHAVSAADSYTPDAPPLQDTFYDYDLVGNVVRTIDRGSSTGIRNNPDSARWSNSDPALGTLIAAGDALARDFTYDALYRLTSATGREGLTVPEPRPWADYGNDGYFVAGAAAPDPGSAPDVTAAFLERYAYDPAANLLSISHVRTTTATTTWVRRFGIGGLSPEVWDQEWRTRLNAPARWINAPGNRLTHVGEGAVPLPASHRFDAVGNLVQEQVDRQFVWNHADNLTQFLIRATPAATPSVDARYLYAADGTRLKKWVRRNGVAATDESCVYIAGIFEHHRWRAGALTRENTLAHVIDTQGRVAVIRTGPAHPTDAGPIAQYQVGDHLGSSHLVVGGPTAADSAFVNREEYLPYGETSFGSFGRKRYRFTGRERDEESGLQYHRARFYAPWLGRWLTADPAGPVDGLNLYAYCRGNPAVLRDPGGLDSDVNGTPDPPPAAAAESGNTTFVKSTVAGYTAGATPAPAPNAAPSPQAAATAPAPRPATPAPAPAPAKPAPTPIATEPPNPMGAQALAVASAVGEGVDEVVLDQKKYLDTWKHPAMSDVTHGLSEEQLKEVRSRFDPAVLSVLNAPISPSTRPLWSSAEHLKIAQELECIRPIVGDECHAATFPDYNQSWKLSNPDNFITRRQEATGQKVPNNEYDAFGHCFDGCRIAQVCGPLTALSWGREREAWREAGYKGDHDSFPQDVHNEARGVLIFLSQPDGGVDCHRNCMNAVDTLLDLSAPKANYR